MNIRKKVAIFILEDLEMWLLGTGAIIIFVFMVCAAAYVLGYATLITFGTVEESVMYTIACGLVVMLGLSILGAGVWFAHNRVVKKLKQWSKL